MLLTDLFTWMLGPRGPLVFMALVIGFALWLIIRDKRGGPVSAGTLAVMLGESVVLALLFGVVVGTATVHLVGPLRSLAAGRGLDGAPLSRLTLSLGAGLYEELLFRVSSSRCCPMDSRLLLGNRPAFRRASSRRSEERCCSRRSITSDRSVNR